jgi:hypothetical protein
MATIDKTKVWFGVRPGETVVHAYYFSHALCDSHDAEKSVSVTVLPPGRYSDCPGCLTFLNRAEHCPVKTAR